MRVVLTQVLRRFVPAAAAAVLILGASPAPQPPAPSAPAPQPSAARARTLVVADMDTGAEACVDFYQYADGGWLAEEPDPVGPAALGNLRRAAAAQPGGPARDPRAAGRRQVRARRVRGAQARRLLRRLHGRGGDRGQGPGPDRSPSSRGSTRSRTCRACAREISRLQPMGVDVLFAFGSEEDRKDSSRVVAAALQAGLGLPERDYYLKTDEKSVAAARPVRRARDEDAGALGREAGEGRVGREGDPGPRDAAGRGLAEQRRLPRPGQDLPSRGGRRRRQGEPEPGMGRYFREQGVPANITVNVWQPDFFKAADGLLKSAPLADLEDVPALAPALRGGAQPPEALRGRELRLLRQDALRHPGDPAALEALRDARRTRRSGWRSGGSTSSRTSRPRPSSAPTRWSRTSSPRCATTSRRWTG